VRPVAALGQDGAELLRLLEEAGVDPVGVERMAGASYHWTAVHGAGGAVDSQQQQLGVYEEWSPRVAEVCRGSQILFLGSMPPRVQLEVMGQCSGADLVAIDTMADFIASDRELLLELITAADIFFANRAELEALLGSGAALNRARSLLEGGRLRAVVVKEGPAGATLVTRLGHQLVPAAPVDRVVDPTGAGDALAGGLLGRLAQLRSSSEEGLRLGLEEGVRRAALAISDFSVRGLLGAACA
jgi:fructose-1-phosphate kinase PfkB-like protein